jgi:16S rRNA (guanine966-N2)-methyltransferase
MKTKRPVKTPTPEMGKLRIIGGQWRGRLLQFPDVTGLRPTGDRVRETLFNWLMGYLPEACCLDLFAGSGALSLEALSRGARAVCALELDKRAAQNIRHHAATLGTQQLTVYCDDTLAYLARGNTKAPYDIVFIDPPFAADLAGQCASLLEQGGWLSEKAWIYIEADKQLPPPLLPNHWQLHREKTAGQVLYRLYQRRPNDDC